MNPHETGGELEWTKGDMSPNGRWLLKREVTGAKIKTILLERNDAARSQEDRFGPLYGCTLDSHAKANPKAPFEPWTRGGSTTALNRVRRWADRIDALELKN